MSTSARRATTVTNAGSNALSSGYKRGRPIRLAGLQRMASTRCVADLTQRDATRNAYRALGNVQHNLRRMHLVAESLSHRPVGDPALVDIEAIAQMPVLGKRAEPAIG